MNIFSALSAFRSYVVDHDVFGDIKREDSRKAQDRKNARKQRARELTKARELEIKKAR
ncbi:MAG: hypothetical protein IKC27_09125 [Kiritimatiellae bacterium]|nr:hypothetical protein [Kiritimatiellia bacterium]